jgi:hypothetical protein
VPEEPQHPRRCGGACDSSVLPEVPIQVLQHYRKWGAIAAGESPWSVNISDPKRMFFFHYSSGMHFFLNFTP